MDPWLCIMLAHGSMVVHTSGPGIHGCASSPGPAFSDVQPARFADVCIRSTNVCRRLHTSGLGIHGCASCWPPWDPSRELHRVPSRGDCIMLARSALITQWNSNQVPWHPSRELHRVPARSSNHARPMDHSMGIQAGAAHGSKVVHHAGPVGVDHSMELQPGPLASIEGTASSPGPQLQPCPAPMESIEGTRGNL